MPDDAARALPFRPLTRLLAEMQTNIIACAMRIFDGELDRFAIFTLIVREGSPGEGARGAISAHSIATSLNHPYETVRRHVGALVAGGYCERRKGGVAPSATMLQRADILQLMILSHDCFVRLTEDLAKIEPQPSRARTPDGGYFAIGVQAAIDIMLATADSNRGLHRDWLDLVIFSTIVLANAQRYERDPGAACVGPRHAVRSSAIARTLNLSETTVRRRIAALTRGDASIVAVREGLLVSTAWLDTRDADETSRTTLSHVRRVITRAAAAGFPVDAPGSAYLNARPAPVVVA